MAVSSKKDVQSLRTWECQTATPHTKMKLLLPETEWRSFESDLRSVSLIDGRSKALIDLLDGRVVAELILRVLDFKTVLVADATLLRRL